MEEVCINPLVSICVPAHNAERFLSATLHCLLAQEYPFFEIIIVNDHSTDRTKEIIFGLNSPKIKYFVSTKRGAASARNDAYKHSSGDLVIFFDADDLVEPNFIAEQVRFWQARDNRAVILSQWGRFYKEDVSDFKIESEEIKSPMDLRGWIVKYWTLNSQMTVPARALIPRNVIERAGGWDENLSLNDDFEFYTRIFGYAERVYVNPNCVLKYRSGINGLSQQKKDEDKQRAQFLSITKATGFVLDRYDDAEVKLGCANVLQAFVYECYPLLPGLTAKAELEIERLGGSDLAFEAGGLTDKFRLLLGWKWTKRLKHFASR